MKSIKPDWVARALLAISLNGLSCFAYYDAILLPFHPVQNENMTITNPASYTEIDEYYLIESGKAMRIDVEDTYLYGDAVPNLAIEVQFFDEGDNWKIKYDATGGQVQVDAVISGSGNWESYVFNITDANFAGNVSGADFQIRAETQDLKVRKITLMLDTPDEWDGGKEEWSISDTAPYAGVHHLQLTTDDNLAFVRREMPAAPGEYWTASAQAKLVSAPGGGSAFAVSRFKFLDASRANIATSISSKLTTIGGSYSEQRIGFIAPAGTVSVEYSLEAKLAGETGSMTVHYDNVVLSSDSLAFKSGFENTTIKHPNPPNILLYIADDLGYGSINSYGAQTSLLSTPNLNQLAATGVQFHNGYASASVCTPTRYALLAGEYSWRSRMKAGTIKKVDFTLLDPDRTSMPKWFQEQGYKTAHVGKWHLGYKDEDDYPVQNLLGDLSPGPVGIGFDYHFGVPYNLEDFHKVYIENNGIWGLQSDVFTPYGNNWYAERNGNVKPYVGYDAPQRVTEEVMNTTTDKAVEWILAQAGSDQPFFINFASVAVHNPIEPTPLMRGTSAAGLYGDFIQDVDNSLGRLMDALDDIGELENTVIIFVSDNGGQTYDSDSPQKDAEDAGLVINGNLRGDKADIWEGGFKSPFIISHLDGKIPQGVTSNSQVCTVDLYATLADYVSGETNNFRREGIDAIDSSSFKDALLNPATSTYDRPPLVLRNGKGRKTIHFDDNWKYMEDFEGSFPAGPQLFNMLTDPLETTNILSSNPLIGDRGQALLNIIVNTSGGSVY